MASPITIKELPIIRVNLPSLGKEAVAERCSVKKVFLEISQNSKENICEFCEVSNNTFSYRAPLVAASVGTMINPGTLYRLTYIL